MAKKLHELLAVEQNVIGGYNELYGETDAVLGRPAAFTKEVTDKEFIDEAEQTQNREWSDITAQRASDYVAALGGQNLASAQPVAQNSNPGSREGMETGVGRA